MRRLLIIALALLATTCAFAAPPRPMTITTDLDHDGTRERIVVDPTQKRVLSVWHGKKLLWQGIKQAWQPWKLMTADVDGDGKREIILGVYKPTRFFRKPHNCLFVYGWDGQRVFPKWLGSSLGKSFDDFMFADLKGSGEDNLVALETRADGLKCAVAYSWIGFGFGVDWERGAWHQAKLVAATRHSVIVEADGKRIVLGQDAAGPVKGRAGRLKPAVLWTGRE